MSDDGYRVSICRKLADLLMEIDSVYMEDRDIEAAVAVLEVVLAPVIARRAQSRAAVTPRRGLRVVD